LSGEIDRRDELGLAFDVSTKGRLRGEVDRRSFDCAIPLARGIGLPVAVEMPIRSALEEEEVELEPEPEPEEVSYSRSMLSLIFCILERGVLSVIGGVGAVALSLPLPLSVSAILLPVMT
jgi:hypothetical protein